MKGSSGKILAILWKDILSEVRSKEIATSMLLFALLVILVFSFAFDPKSENVGLVAPGVLWVAFTFAGVLGLNRIFASEKEKGCLEGLMLCPVERDIIYWGKLIGVLIFMSIVEAILTPLFLILFDLSLWMPELALIAPLATVGFASVGTLFAALAASTRARDITLPILFLPIVVPIIIAAVEATQSVMNEEPWNDFSSWLIIMASFDVIFLIVSALVFEFVLEE